MIKMKKNLFFRVEEENGEEQDIYDREVRESMLDDDEISVMEETFMCGYDQAV